MALGPFDRKFIQVVWGGTLPGLESWCCSLKLCHVGESVDGAAARLVNNQWIENTTDAAFQAWVDGSLKDSVVAYHSSSALQLAPQARLEFVKMNPINEDGHYQRPNTFQTSFAPISGGGSSGRVPNQISLVVTLLTNVSRGPASKGRFYLPMPNLPMDNEEGLYLQANVDQVRDVTKTFLESIADVPGADFVGSAEPAVMSRKDGAPASREVKQVSVGRAPDTQRRRRRNLKENYRNTAVDFGVF